MGKPGWVNKLFRETSWLVQKNNSTNSYESKLWHPKGTQSHGWLMDGYSPAYMIVVGELTHPQIMALAKCQGEITSRVSILLQPQPPRLSSFCSFCSLGDPLWEGLNPHDPWGLVDIYCWLVIWNHGILWLSIQLRRIYNPNWRSHIFHRGRLKPPTRLSHMNHYHTINDNFQ